MSATGLPLRFLAHLSIEGGHADAQLLGHLPLGIGGAAGLLHLLADQLPLVLADHLAQIQLGRLRAGLQIEIKMNAQEARDDEKM